MKLIIKTDAGKQANWSGLFDQQSISIGRGPEADVRLHSSQTLCSSGIHLKLLLESGRWMLLSCHQNGVTLVSSNGEKKIVSNGERVPLTLPCRLIIGQTGPCIDITSDNATTTASISLRVVRGHRAGWEESFDRDVISIGRSADADVRMDPRNDLACGSGIHARLTREGNRWSVVCEHASGVVLTNQGRRTTLDKGEKTVLSGISLLTLGKGGPQIVLTPPASADDIPPTCAPGWRPRLAELQSRIAPVCQRATPVVGRMRAAFSERVTWRHGVFCLAVLISYMISGSVISAFVPDVRQKHGDLKQHLESAKGGVFAIGSLDKEGNFSPGGGTAWVVQKGLLATNGHVAEFVDECIKAGWRPVARLPGETPRDLRVLSTRSHPGWLRWKSICNATLVSRSGSRVNLAPIFDVALLVVEGETGPALPLASAEELLMLRGGYPVGYVGYPVENITGIKDNFPATCHTGQITAVTDVMGENTSSSDSLLLQLDLTISGGASGSPVLNSSGKVVGIVNAGNMVSITDQGTFKARVSIGLNIAQRVDLVRELFEDSVESKQVTRDQIIQERLDAILMPPREFARQLTAQLLETLKKDGKLPRTARLRQVRHWEGNIRAGSDGHSEQVRFEANSIYLIVTCAVDSSDMDVRIMQGSACLARDEEARAVGLLTFTAQQDINVTIVAHADKTHTTTPRAFLGVYVVDL